MENFIAGERLQRGHAWLLVGDHHWALQQVLSQGLLPLSVEELAELRCELGPYHRISWTGARVRESFAYLAGRYFLLKPPVGDVLLRMEAPQWHASQREFPLHDHLREGFYLEVPTEDFVVPTEELDVHPVGEFLFGAQAKAYRDWLTLAHVPALPLSLPPMSLLREGVGDFVRPLVLRCTDNWSGLTTVNNLHEPYGVWTWSEHLPPEWERFVEPEESFGWERLEPMASLVGLAPADYTLRELQAAAEENGRLHLLGPALRLLRGGSSLPVSHATFARDEIDGTDL